jgi:hypothetical protein
MKRRTIRTGNLQGVRQGWAEAFRIMAESADDDLRDLDSTHRTSWDEKEWQWDLESSRTASHAMVYCKRCQASFPVPDLSEPDRDRIASSVRAGQHVQATTLLRELAGLDIRDAKAVEMHITRTPGVCVRCRRQLPGLGETECPQCGSLALDW